MKTRTSRNHKIKRWMPLAVIAAGGCFLGVEATAQSSQSQQSSASQARQSDADLQQAVREQLKQEGLSDQRIDQLAQDGFDPREIEIALIAVYERDQGLDRQQAQQKAQQMAQQVASSQSPDQADEQSWAQEVAPQGAEVQDSATMVLNEEELEVQTRRVPVGGILLRKKIITEDASESVQLRSEDIEIVRLSPEEAQQRQEQEYQSGFDEPFQEGEIFIPLMQEEAIANTEVETRQVVRAKPSVETEQKQFDATLRSEQVEVERVGAEQQDEDFSARLQFDTLEQLIRSELRSGDIGLNEQQIDQIQIEVDENSVTLSGTVPDEQTKRQIEEVVSGLPQVEEVDNQLEM